MTATSLRERFRRDVETESDSILGELARLMSPALRTRAEEVAAIAQTLGMDVPMPIAWMLDLDVPEPLPSAEDLRAPHAPVAPSTAGTERKRPSKGGTPEDLKRQREERDQTVVNALTQHGPMRWQVLADRTGFYDSKLKAALDSLGERVVKGEDGCYRLAGTPEPRLKRASEPTQHVAVNRPVAKPAAPRTTGETYTTRSGRVRTKPTHPGIEAVPKHLRHLPAAQEGGPLRQRVETAELQRRILDDVLAHPTAISNEVAERLGMNDAKGRGRIAKHMTALMDAGLIRRTGINRRVPGNTIGKASIEYAPPVVHTDPKKVEVPPSQAAQAPARTGVTESAKRDSGAADRPTQLHDASGGGASSTTDVKGAELLAKHRDYAVSREGKGPFTPLKCGEALGVPEAVSAAMLSLLADRGTVEDVGVPGMVAYEYHRPTTPGAAAERDRARAKERAKSEGNGHGLAQGVEVAGSGWDPKQFSPNSDVQRLLRLAKNKWGRGCISKLGNNHIRIATPSGPITIGSTPGKAGLKDAQRYLSNAGLAGAMT